MHVDKIKVQTILGQLDFIDNDLYLLKQTLDEHSKTPDSAYFFFYFEQAKVRVHQAKFEPAWQAFEAAEQALTLFPTPKPLRPYLTQAKAFYYYKTKQYAQAETEICTTNLAAM